MGDTDELCALCAAVPLYSLFTGPRFSGDADDIEGEQIEHALGTLDRVWTNVNCPLCRMVKHCVQGGGADMDIFERISTVCNPADVKVNLWAERVDSRAEMNLEVGCQDTRKLLATKLVVRLLGPSQVAQLLFKNHQILQDIQLLSPNSIDPARPLQNGFLAPSMDASLDLLRTWIDECKEHHCSITCPSIIPTPGSQDRVLTRLRAIDVASLALVEIDPTVSQYATLSYVWGDKATALPEESTTPRLPATLPQLILDAIGVCTKLDIPYLWTDRYCIHQADHSLKAIEIAQMGRIYQLSTITLVAGSPTSSTLLPHPNSPNEACDPRDAPQQLTVTLPGTNHTLVSQFPPLGKQIQFSPWATRSWTFQEGNLARRLAFFNPPYPLTFVCGSGLFSPTLHSGPTYGHSCHMPPLKLDSSGVHLMAGHGWLTSSPERSFLDYARIVNNYGCRKLTFESDKLLAVEGCLTAVGVAKGVEFVWGMPMAGFHYALLWLGEDRITREGFPSWCWAGWMTATDVPVNFLIVPDVVGKGLVKGQDDIWSWEREEGKSEVMPDRFLYMASDRESRHRLVWLSQYQERLAGLRLTGPRQDILRIDSEVVRAQVGYLSGPMGETPCSAVCCEVLKNSGLEGLEEEKMYKAGYVRCGVYLRDGKGNVYHDRFMWREGAQWPIFAVRLPFRLTGRDVRWLMEDGLELVKIVELELGCNELRLPPLRHVLCLGVDRRYSKGVEGRGRRMGVFAIPWDMWDKAGPEKMVVELE